MTTLRSALEKDLRGDVLFSASDLNAYSCDESIFTLLPKLVVAPKDEADLQAIVNIAHQFRVPLTARGAGTSVAGQAIGQGVVIDFKKYMNRVLEVSGDRAVVQPGVLLDDLNAGLKKIGKRFAPDPASHAWCTIGGMVGNNASGPLHLKYGATRDHVQNLKCVLADGNALWSSQIIKTFKDIPVIHSQTRKNSSGYFSNALLESSSNITNILVGSEGTLALISEIEIRLIDIPKKTSTAIFSFDSIEGAMEAVDAIRKMDPAALELIDHFILEALKKIAPRLASELNLEKKEASLWARWEGDLPAELSEWDVKRVVAADEQEKIWHLRSLASKELQNQTGNRRPLRCIEDGVVPQNQLTTYVYELREILRKHDCDGAIFGHAGDAHVHVNPNIDVRKPHLAGRIENLMEEAYGLVLRLGGSISGEHGDGLLRKHFAHVQWKQSLPIFRAIKESFDPDYLFNPGKKFDWPESDTVMKKKFVLPNCLKTSF